MTWALPSRPWCFVNVYLEHHSQQSHVPAPVITFWETAAHLFLLVCFSAESGFIDTGEKKPKPHLFIVCSFWFKVSHLASAGRQVWKDRRYWEGSSNQEDLWGNKAAPGSALLPAGYSISPRLAAERLFCLPGDMDWCASRDVLRERSLRLLTSGCSCDKVLQNQGGHWLKIMIIQEICWTAAKKFTWLSVPEERQLTL